MKTAVDDGCLSSTSKKMSLLHRMQMLTMMMQFHLLSRALNLASTHAYQYAIHHVKKLFKNYCHLYLYFTLPMYAVVLLVPYSSNFCL